MMVSYTSVRTFFHYWIKTLEKVSKIVVFNLCYGVTVQADVCNKLTNSWDVSLCLK